MSVDIEGLLGDQASYLLEHRCEAIPQDLLTLPGRDFVTEVLSATDRSPQVMRNMQSLFDNGRLANSGYVSILPVDQGIEHSAAASFAPNPMYFDPANIVELAIEGGCNAVATTFGVLILVAKKADVSSKKPLRLSKKRTNLECSRCSGATCGTV